MSEEEVRATTGTDLVGAMLAVFREVTPVMNLCLLVKLGEPDGERIAP